MEDNRDFYCSCCSCCFVVLNWKDKNAEEKVDYYQYKLEQKLGKETLFTSKLSYNLIYMGKDLSYEVTDLEPNNEYTFKLKIKKYETTIEEKNICIKTLKSPLAVLSENSVKIANNGKIINKINLSNSDKQIISNCSKFIFGKNNENVIEADFEAIKMKITQEKESNIYYISFDVVYEFFNDFISNFIQESENNLIIPCHSIVQNLPTILIFNILEKGPVIFTGKRMGGVIASSLAFYILYIGQSININYGNTFEKKEKNCIGVVTFGSPSFLTNMIAAVKMMKFTPYFYHIKEEFDYIPGIIDFINKEAINISILNIFNKMKLNLVDKKMLVKFLSDINYNEENLRKKLNYLKFLLGNIIKWIKQKKVFPWIR